MPRLARRCAAPLSLAVVLGVLVAAPASAAGAWTPTAEVSNDGLTFPASPVVRMDAEGAGTMVWLAAPTEGATTGLTVRASSHPVGGPWSPPADLAAGALVDQLDLAVDPVGNALAVWTQEVSGVDVVEYATRTPAGSWSTADELSDLSVDSSSPTVGVDAAGNAVVLWVTDVAGTNAIVGATRTAGGTWGVVAPLSDTENNATDPDVAVAPDGSATAVWVHFDAAKSVDRVETASRSSATTDFVTDPTPLSSDTADAHRPTVSVNAAGVAVAAWEQEAPDPDHGAVYAALRTSEAWGSPALVSSAPNPADDQDEKGSVVAAVDAAGSATVAWRRSFRVMSSDPRQRTVETAATLADHSWTVAEKLGSTNDLGGLDLALDGSGKAIAAWPSEGTNRIEAATRAVSGGWSDPIAVESSPGRGLDAAVAADPDGDLLVGWGISPDTITPGTVKARALDATSPVIRSLNVPASGTTGTAATFSVDAVDAWSSVGSVKWLFSDGTSATGASVSHTYAAAGTYLVTATVSDAYGNARSRSGSIVVAAAPVVTPPPPAAPPKPALTGVKLTRKTIHVKGSDEQPQATKLKLTLNTDGKVTVKLKRTQKLGGRAVTAKLAKSLTQGARAIRLTSKVGGKKLPPGTYRVTVRAANAQGTSPAVTVRLTIKK